MGIGYITDAVELQIGVAQTRFRGFFAKVGTLRKFDTVGGRLHALVPDLSAIADGPDKMRRKRRLTAGKLNGKLPSRLNRDGIIEQHLDLFPAQFMYESDLVGVHEA